MWLVFSLLTIAFTCASGGEMTGISHAVAAAHVPTVITIHGEGFDASADRVRLVSVSEPCDASQLVQANMTLFNATQNSVLVHCLVESSERIPFASFARALPLPKRRVETVLPSLVLGCVLVCVIGWVGGCVLWFWFILLRVCVCVSGSGADDCCFALLSASGPAPLPEAVPVTEIDIGLGSSPVPPQKGAYWRRNMPLFLFCFAPDEI